MIVTNQESQENYFNHATLDVCQSNNPFSNSWVFQILRRGGDMLSNDLVDYSANDIRSWFFAITIDMHNILLLINLIVKLGFYFVSTDMFSVIRIIGVN